MIFPYKIIESKISSRKQFVQSDGYQPTYALFYLKKGDFVMEINGLTQQLHAGDCVLLPDNLYFRRAVLNPIEFVYVMFCRDFSCPYSFDIPFGKVSVKDKERFLSSIDAIEKYIDHDDRLSAGYREHLLMDILFQLFYEHNAPYLVLAEKLCTDRLVSDATEYIRQNLDKKLLIGDICHAVNTNASTLNFKFRREFEMSIGQFILSERMKKAKKLLIGTTYSVSEIALKCGFDNVYYFSNMFKKMMGVSPTRYIDSYET